uniref:Uncharacterized protein n=1 Tax=Moniliophthora roreri TaxID=221103 RepID=A0A0W0G5E1_MONRR
MTEPLTSDMNIPRLLTVLFLALLFQSVHAQMGFDSCRDSGLAWYTDIVGETPCSTYERLRQICNPTYRVGRVHHIESPADTPPDVCNDQLNERCCNGFSFALSMLCANCQLGVGGQGQGTGLDASAGTYQLYLGGTEQHRELVQDQIFTEGVQSAICNEGIKILRSLYGIAWTSGAWYFIHTRDIAVEDHVAYGEKAFYDACSTDFRFTSALNQPPQTSLPTFNTTSVTFRSSAAPSISFLEVPSQSPTARITTSIFTSSELSASPCVSLGSGTLSPPPPMTLPSTTNMDSMTSTSSDISIGPPGSIVTPKNREPSSMHAGSRTGRLVGIAVGSVIGSVLMVGTCFLAARKMRYPWKPIPLITPFLGHLSPPVPRKGSKLHG